MLVANNIVVLVIITITREQSKDNCCWQKSPKQYLPAGGPGTVAFCLQDPESPLELFYSPGIKENIPYSQAAEVDWGPREIHQSWVGKVFYCQPFLYCKNPEPVSTPLHSPRMQGCLPGHQRQSFGASVASSNSKFTFLSIYWISWVMGILRSISRKGSSSMRLMSKKKKERERWWLKKNGQESVAQ